MARSRTARGASTTTTTPVKSAHREWRGPEERPVPGPEVSERTHRISPTWSSRSPATVTRTTSPDCRGHDIIHLQCRDRAPQPDIRPQLRVHPLLEPVASQRDSALDGAIGSDLEGETRCRHPRARRRPATRRSEVDNAIDRSGIRTRPSSSTYSGEPTRYSVPSTSPSMCNSTITSPAPRPRTMTFVIRTSRPAPAKRSYRNSLVRTSLTSSYVAYTTRAATKPCPDAPDRRGGRGTAMVVGRGPNEIVGARNDADVDRHLVSLSADRCSGDRLGSDRKPAISVEVDGGPGSGSTTVRPRA